MTSVKNYAVVNSSSGIVENIILWDGESSFSAPDGFMLVVQPDDAPINIGYTYKKGKFIAPESSPPTDEDLAKVKQQAINANNYRKESYMDTATRTISTLQDAVDLDMATDDEKKLLPEWKKYRVLLSRIDANTDSEITWPEMPA